MYGDIKTANSKEQNLLKPDNSTMLHHKGSCGTHYQDIEIIFRKIKEEFPKLTDKIRCLNEEKSTQIGVTVVVDQDSIDTLTKCGEYLAIINQVSSLSNKK